jgi:hypothetical protein
MVRLPFALLLTATAVTSANAWKIERVEISDPVLELIEVGGEARVATASGWLRVVSGEKVVRFEKAPAPRFAPIPADALPDARIASGKKEIARVWYARPTTRYGHGVLGDAIEAESVVIESRDGKVHTVAAGRDAVFEDIEPRVAVLGDGGEKIVAVKSYLAAGAALAVIGKRGNGYAILAETPPIGTPNRWLNPTGIADFDGEGSIEIALVRMPHALGRMELWRWSSNKLTKIAETRDTSNHAIGSRSLKLSAVADFDGDGVADLAIPSFDRRSIRLLSFKGGIREIARLALPAPVTTDFVLLQGTPPGILLGLANGELIRLRR